MRPGKARLRAEADRFTLQHFQLASFHAMASGVERDANHARRLAAAALAAAMRTPAVSADRSRGIWPATQRSSRIAHDSPCCAGSRQIS